MRLSCVQPMSQVTAPYLLHCGRSRTNDSRIHHSPARPLDLGNPRTTEAHPRTHARTFDAPKNLQGLEPRPAIKAAPPASCPLAFQGQILTLLYFFCFLHVLAGGGGGGGGGGACSAPADRLDFGAPPVYARARGNSDANRGHAVGEEEEEEEGIESSTYRNACLPPHTDRILVSSLLYPLPCFASRCDLHVSRPWMAISRCGNRTIPRRVAPHWAQALSRFEAGRTPTVLAAPAKYRRCIPCSRSYLHHDRRAPLLLLLRE
ncbi:hypothetical protein PCL_00126 [Purpureocillium lilacinum]|uniref:Uncharacterized protein n=1 Tax=Purpureocillium lilacinum TaxID=33203 RepID=A0A2U3E643_PURLI|nr:hypothetical protein PCL_00126 [Purpureocillium lilacinum]